MLGANTLLDRKAACPHNLRLQQNIGKTKHLLYENRCLMGTAVLFKQLLYHNKQLDIGSCLT